MSDAISDMGKHPANFSTGIKPIARQAGATKGQPRTPGAGRKKGVPNRITRDVREAAQKHGAKALKRLVQLMADPDARVAISAVREVLDRAYGRPVSPQEITGKDGAPIVPEMDGRKMAQTLAFMLAKGVKESGKEMPKQPKPGADSPTPAPSFKPVQSEPVAPAEPAASDPAATAPAREWIDPDEHRAMMRSPEQRDHSTGTPRVVSMFNRNRSKS